MITSEPTTPRLTCPPNALDVAEAYLLNRLSPAEAITFEEHYLACSRCAEILEREQKTIGLIRAALS